MGYDIEFHFDPGQKYDKQELLDRFVRTGAALDHDHGHPTYHDPIIVMPGGYGGFLNQSSDAICEGRWVDGRCPRDREGLERYVELAAQVRARLYDPQAKIYVTLETIPQILAALGRFMGIIGDMFGEVDDGKEPERAE